MVQKMKVSQIIWPFITLIGVTYGFALAPSTVGGVVASAGKLSNTIKESNAWKRLTAHPNSLVRMLPARAMEVVQEVVGSFRRESQVIIETPQGRLRGKIQRNKSGNTGTFYSFRGIRYGQPPMGSRRFRAALPEKPWRGVRDALREGSTCPHKNMILETYKGSEDCLFLNVFTKRLPDEDYHPNLPVMVWLHGGGYAFGSGNSFLYGPDFLVAEDIVLVTINYRLGPLGFLSAGPDAPGNAGLKDQVLALKWVQENIEAFGGNQKQVTIFGESAGGSSVQYLIVSPMARGLFHRAISQSGSALNPWAKSDDPMMRAFRLARSMGYKTNNTRDLLSFLRQVPARKLVENSLKSLTADDIRRSVGFPFVPTIEGQWHDDVSNKSFPFLEEPFLHEDPYDIYQKGEFAQVPYIIGYNSHEAMIFIRRLRQNPALMEIINNDFIRLIPRDLDIPGGHASQYAQNLTQIVKEFYLGSRDVSMDTIEEMIYLFTDVMFLRGIARTARLHSIYSTAPIYVYRFAFDGSLGFYKRMLGISRPGVCHGDELGYLFQFGFFNLSLDPASPEIIVKKRLVKMWTNFAKYGNPTPNGANDNSLSIDWEPVASTRLKRHANTTTPIKYLDITSRLEERVNPESQRLAFWDELYKYYNGELV